VSTLQLAQDHIEAVCDALGVDPDIRAQAESLAVAADESARINRAPTVTAAGAVYLAGQRVGDQYAQAAVGHAADVSTVSIRDAYQELLSLDAGDSWAPEPATLREGKSKDRSAHARRNAEQLRLAREALDGGEQA
jgi:hypothetical protein